MKILKCTNSSHVPILVSIIAIITRSLEIHKFHVLKTEAEPRFPSPKLAQSEHHLLWRQSFTWSTMQTRREGYANIVEIRVKRGACEWMHATRGVSRQGVNEREAVSKRLVHVMQNTTVPANRSPT